MSPSWLAAGLAAAIAVAAAFAATPAGGRELLPADAVPVSYKIDIVPDVPALTFAGTVEVELDLAAPTATIVLNAADLQLDKAELSGVNGEAAIALDETTERATLRFPEEAAAGRHTLTIAYRGKIYETSYGLFATPYRDGDVEKTMLSTQFEPGAARRFAPMWDEPSLKAVWQLSITVPEAETAVSNMPIVEETKADGRKRVTFAPSPKMSSYLLFVAAGDLERVATTAHGVDIGVVTRKGEGKRAQFALEITGPLLGYFNEYFGAPYTLPKLDHIGAPGAGGFGAMENWGAIFYFESSLLVDPALTTETDRQRIYGTIAHEVAHQWFGDLVTMAWWDDLWLNEGFASWMQKKAGDHFQPDWNVWLQAIKVQQEAMEIDSRASTHPVVQPVRNVAEAETAFDDITYDKGQSVIRMLEAYLGEDAFRDGVRAYMAKHAYANTVTDDLWSALETASGVPVRDIARDFTLQPGIPLIVVDAVSCVDGVSKVTVHQKRFAVDESANDAMRWRVPVVAVGEGGQGETARALVDGMAEIAVSGCGQVKLNAGNTSYFRTLYPPAQFAALADAFPRMKPDDQLGMLHDSFALGAAGSQPVGDYLALSGTLAYEADPVVWLQVVNTYSKLADLYRGEMGEAEFLAYGRGRLRPLLERIGWDSPADEPPNVGVLRDALIETLAKLGDEQVIAEAEHRFAAFEADPKSLPGGIRRAVTRAVAMNADAATWQKLRDLAFAAPTPLEQRLYLDALTYVNDPALAERTLELAVGDAPKQTGPRMITSVATRHPDIAWRFLEQHPDQVFERMDAMSRYSFIPRLAAKSSNPERAQELKQFFDKVLPGAPQGEMNRAIGEIRSESDVRVKRLPEINDWLSRTQ